MSLTIMKASFQNLLRYTASKVTSDMIRWYTPAPESPGCLEAVRASLVVPYPTEFDLNEPINLTAWGDPLDYESPDEFRAFRRFTTSIILHPMDMDAISGYQPLDRFHGCDFLAHDLLLDVSRNDEEHLSLLSAAMKTAREILTSPIQDVLPDFQYIDDDCVFFTFGLLYLSQLIEDWTASEHFATQLILDIHEGDLNNGEMVDYPSPGKFWHEKTRENWFRMINSLRNPTKHADTETVMRRLGSTRRNAT